MKGVAANLLPEKYGDKLDVNQAGNVTVVIREFSAEDFEDD